MTNIFPLMLENLGPFAPNVFRPLAVIDTGDFAEEKRLIRREDILTLMKRK